jgi:hypothetical protein
MVSDSLHRAARVFEPQPGCGCAKRQARMNAVVPGSGDAVKAVASGIAWGLRGAARRISGLPELRGYEPVRRCDRAAIYSNGRTYQVITLIDGKLASSGAHGFCKEAMAIEEFEARCR